MSMLCLIFATLASLVSPTCLESSTSPSGRPVKVGVNTWFGAEANAWVAKILLEEKMGMNTEFVRIPVEQDQWQDMENEKIDIILEVWPSGHIENLLEYAVVRNTVMNAGNLGVVGRIGWYIPKYVIEEDPFLEYWRTLTRQDAIEKFHYSRNTCGNGEEFCEGALFLGGHEAWVQWDQSIIDSLNLNISIEWVLRDDPDAAEDVMLDFLEENFLNDNKPVIFYMWTPHQIHVKHDFVRLMLPEYYDGCLTNPDGINCDYPSDVLYKIAARRISDTQPQTEFFVKMFSYSTEDQSKILAWHSYENMTLEEAACRWVKENEDRWKVWIPPSPEILSPKWENSLSKVVVAFCIFFMIISLILAALIFLYRDKQVIKFASPPFCMIILLASVVVYSFPLLLVGKPTNVICNLRPIILGGSFVTLFGALFAKTYRVSRIFNNKKMRKMAIKNAELFRTLFVVLFIEIVLLAIYVGAFPSEFAEVRIKDKLRQAAYQCVGDDSSDIMLIILYGFKGFLLLYGCFLSVKVWNVGQRFNESRAIAFFMYNILFFSVVIIGLNTTLEEEPVASFMLQSFGIMVATFTGILVLFVPKIYIIFSGKLEDNGEDSAISTGTGNNSGTHSEVKKSARTSRLSKQASSENQRS